MNTITPILKIQNLIHLVRNKKVMLDSDLADIYGVKTKRLNEQMKLNKKRFPTDFCFQLNEREWKNLRSQFATANLLDEKRRGLPYVFTEHGAIMLASVLDSPQAVLTSTKVVRSYEDGQRITVYSPSRFDPILPGLYSKSEQILFALNPNLDNREIKWRVHADNSRMQTGSISLNKIQFKNNAN